jgi:hypothetical protein
MDSLTIFVNNFFAAIRPIQMSVRTYFDLSRDRFCFPREEPKPEWSGTYVQIHPQRDPITGTDGYCYLYTSSHFRGKRSNEPRQSGYIGRYNIDDDESNAENLHR